MLDTVVISGEDVCCGVVFGTLVGVFVFSVMWSELLMISAISCPLWSSVYECYKVECCCLPTPMTFASGGSLIFPLVVHQPASASIWPVVQSLQRGLSTIPGVTVWCVCGCS